MITTVNSDRKNSVAFGFRPLVTKPEVKAPRAVRSPASLCKSSVTALAGCARSALKPMYNR
ncbi:hypothetical protein D3C78_1841630 [compost metagenome]